MLPNGLRYALMRPAVARGGVSIRLGIDVGSFEESDAERGMAHFVEHMAFRSTRNFPNSTVEHAFAAEGVSLGRDHNALTDLFSTTYIIDLARAEPGSLASAFTWLRDIADGIAFDPAAVDKERGVVLAEKEARDSGAEATRDALARFKAPGMRVVDRIPIGVDAVLRGATPAALQAFHARWYRPENAIVVVVSDLPEEAIRAQIDRAFGSWWASTPPPGRAAYESPDAKRGLDVFTRSDGSGFTSVDICTAGQAERRPPQDFEHVRTDALGLIWREVLNQRLAPLREVASNQMLGSQIEAWTDGRNLRLTCLLIKPTNDAWAPALAAGQAELARFQASGPTELEVERAIDAVRSRLRGAIGDAPNRTTAMLADAILRSILEGQSFIEPRQALRAYDISVEDITAADVLAAFRRDWIAGGPLISVVAPEAPEAAEVKLAWASRGDTGRLGAYTDPAVANAWAYGDAPAGVVVSRQSLAIGGFTRLRFRNGVVLNFKRTAFSKAKAVMFVRFGAGRRQIQDRDLLAATFGAPVVPFGGLGRHSYDEIVRIMRVDVRDLAIQIGPQAFVISSEEPVVNLENKLKVAAAFLVDPGFRPTMDPVLREGAELTYRMTDTTPALRAGAALSDRLAPGGPLNLPPKAELMKIDSARLAAVLKPVMTTGPVDVTLVGDLDEATAIRLVAASFGALPPRARPPESRSDAYFVRYPAQAPPPAEVEHNGPVDKAVAQLVWPLYVAAPERRREEYSIGLLATIFSNELRRELRGELGKTYAPLVLSQMPDHGDQGVLVASLESYPRDLQVLVKAARTVALRLSSGAIDAEQLAVAKAALLADNRRAMATNVRWAAAISLSTSDGGPLRDILDYESIVGGIRLDEVRKAAADWLGRDPIVMTAISAKATVTEGGS